MSALPDTLSATTPASGANPTVLLVYSKLITAHPAFPTTSLTTTAPATTNTQ